MAGKAKRNNLFSKSHARRARVEFPVVRIHSLLRKGLVSRRQNINRGAAIYLAAVLESVVADVLDLASETARDNKCPVHFEQRTLIQSDHLPFPSYSELIQ